jgi:hypothetical protein
MLATSFMLVSCLPYSSILKMEATFSLDTSLDFLWATSVMSKKIELLIKNK